jgi:spore coat polysaccharide biosynthesis predicted glycosyltransferase SpsG
MKLMCVLSNKINKKIINYVWIYMLHNFSSFFYVKIGKKNNTIYDILLIDSYNLINILYILIKKNNTHSYYWIDKELFSNFNTKYYMIK